MIFNINKVSFVGPCCFVFNDKLSVLKTGNGKYLNLFVKKSRDLIVL